MQKEKKLIYNDQNDETLVMLILAGKKKLMKRWRCDASRRL